MAKMYAISYVVAVILKLILPILTVDIESDTFNIQ